VTFEAPGRMSPARWADTHLSCEKAISGKLPVGPGWRIEGREWAGLALTREQMGREFAEMGAAYLDGPGRLRIEFEPERPISELTVLHGYPPYMDIVSAVERPSFEIVLNGQTVDSVAASDSHIWSRESVRMTPGSGQSQKIEIRVGGEISRLGFYCFRIIGK
jgi:hypothetical protein